MKFATTVGVLSLLIVAAFGVTALLGGSLSERPIKRFGQHLIDAWLPESSQGKSLSRALLASWSKFVASASFQ